MTDKKPFYITTTLPYVNNDPHVGFAMEIIRADIIARYKQAMGYDVFFNTGTDEHGQKIWQNAVATSIPVEQYVGGYSEKFKLLIDLLNISPDIHFIRTTDSGHIKAAQEFWKLCKDRGYIYKKNYQTKYCVGCELEKTDSELNEKGECPLHPGRPIELIDEENYFFKFSEFQKPLLEFYAKNPNFVVPDFRFNEIKAFVERGLEDFSISRLKSKMSWGVPVPDDSEHVMYVWFDALVNYISTLGWPTDTENFEKFWANGNPTQYAGKDNLRQQSAMWQAMLMAAGLPNSHQIVINGFFTGEGGIKMSKSIGNVVNPYDVVRDYGTDALRFFVASEASAFEDSPFTMERFKEAYNAKLANGIGNLTSRIMKMADTNGVKVPEGGEVFFGQDQPAVESLENFNIAEFANDIWTKIQNLDAYIQKNEPFKKIKTDPEAGKKDIEYLLTHLRGVALMMEPMMPETSRKIKECIKENKMPSEPLFLRKD